MEKATIKDLIVRKMQKEENAIKFYDVEVKSLGGKVITFKRPTDQMRLDMMDEIGNDPTTSKSVEAYKKIIYLSCDLLHNKELHDELEIQDPYDTVDKIFDLDDILEIGEKLMDAMDALPGPEEIKNS